MDPMTAANLLGCSPDEEEFRERWQILQRMHGDEAFMKAVVDNYSPPYFVK